MSVFTSFWEFLTSGIDGLFNVIEYATTYITAIPRGIATFTYYINNLPPFVAPFLITIVTVSAVKTIFSLV